MEAELGDLLFTVVNLGRHLGVDAEMALRGCNLRFRQRFREMELSSEKPLEELKPEELEALWAEAKRKLATARLRSGVRPMILIRACSGHDELEACVQMQIETWGYDDSDIIPRKAFLVGQKIGGQVIGRSTPICRARVRMERRNRWWVSPCLCRA